MGFLDSVKGKFLWTRHALREAVEDSFKPSEVELALNKCLLIKTGLGKEKAICKINEKYCTVIFIRMKLGFKIITCWKSSSWEITAFNGEVNK